MKIIKTFFKEDHKDEYFKDGYHSFFDKNKGYVRVDPYPSTDELKEYYEGTYFEGGKIVKHDYLREEKIYLVTYLKYIDSIFNFLDHKKQINILDYACGVGNFVRSLLVSKFQDQINSIDGYDISETAIKIASQNTKQMKAHYYSSEDFYLKQKYDLISMLEVIEHIPNLEDVFKRVSQTLRDDGLIFITTPNYNSFEQRFFKDKWRMFCPPEHINFFTKKTASDFLIKNNYEIISINDEFIFSFSLNLRKSMSSFASNEIISLLTSLKKLLVYNLFNKFLRFIGFDGGKLTIIARKKKTQDA